MKYPKPYQKLHNRSLTLDALVALASADAFISHRMKTQNKFIKDTITSLEQELGVVVKTEKVL